MNIKIVKSVSAATILASSFMFNVANAGLVELQWDTSVMQLNGWAPSSYVGELVSVIITVDNGNSSLLNQTWEGVDFREYRIEGASGWVFGSSSITNWTGSFDTDSVGSVTSAGSWYDEGTPANPVVASWTPSSTSAIGGWYNDSYNPIASVSIPGESPDNISLTDATNNQIGSSWTARVSDVPEPSTLAIFALGLMGLSLRCFKKKA
jgi:hypothetical protein